MVKSTNNIKNPTLIKISLTCSSLALDACHHEMQDNSKGYFKEGSFRDKDGLQPANFLLDYLLTSYLTGPTFELRSQLVETLNSISRTSNLNQENRSVKNERLRQYLRKFSFLYRYFYLKVYPNNLSTLSIKKVNMLAIKSIFLLHGI